MPTYKKQIEEHLLKYNWEVSFIHESDQWWIDEYWEIKSIKNNIDLELFIIFEVDPMYEDTRYKGQGIWNIEAMSKFPLDRLDKEFSVSSISMIKGKFSIKLINFIRGLNDYRKRE